MSTKTFEDILDHPLEVPWASADGRLEREVREHLTDVGAVELDDESFSFNLIRFYVRKADGQVLYATDSGCSCPIPFEEWTVGDLREVNVYNVARTILRNHNPERSRIDRGQMIETASRVQREVMEDGGR